MELQASQVRGSSQNGQSSFAGAKTTRYYKNCGIPDDLLDGIFEPEEGKIDIQNILAQVFQPSD
jgi:hypothetical protein